MEESFSINAYDTENENSVVDENEKLINDDVIIQEEPRFEKVVSERSEPRKNRTISSPSYWTHKFWLLCVTMSCAGVQFSYTIQFALGTPLFNDTFKIPASNVTFILAICGPVSGFIVQPIVCNYSDSASGFIFRWGRRRPFIFIGTIGCSLSMLLVAFSARIGGWLGDNSDGDKESDHIVGIILSITGFVFMNIFVNVIQGPARTLIADLLPEEERDEGNGMVSAVMGFANCLGNLIGAPFTTLSHPYEILFLIGSFLLFLTMFPTLIASNEKRFRPTEKRKHFVVFQNFIDLGKGLVAFGKDRRLWPIIAVFYCSWSAYAPLMIFETQYFGKDIYNGDPDTSADTYHTGIKVGMLVLALFAFVQTIYGFFSERVQRKFGLGLTYAVTQIFATFAYFGLTFFPTLWIAMFMVALTAPNFATFNAVPFTLTQNLVGEERMGLYTGVLNGGSVIAQSITNLLICSFVVKAAGEDVKWGIFVGAPFSIAAIVVALMLQETKRSKDEIRAERKRQRAIEKNAILVAENLQEPPEEPV